jgi:carbon-monoxide dehydrogenase medium subunit
VAEALETVSEYAGNAFYLAGGTDLVNKMRSGKLKPEAVIDLSSIPCLSKTEKGKDELTIGSMVRLADLAKIGENHREIQSVCDAASHISSVQIRNIATLGGNVCNASPSADTVPPLLAYDASVNIIGSYGRKRVPLSEFFVGPGKTVLTDEELVTGFSVPLSVFSQGAVYKKYSIRGDSDLAIIGVAACLRIDDSSKILDAKIAMGAVGPTALRAKNAEKILVGQNISDALFVEAAELAASEAKPITDQRASASYRKDMVRVWSARVLKEAALFASAFNGDERHE